MEMQPMDEQEPEQQYINLDEAISTINKVTEELSGLKNELKYANKVFHPQQLESLHKSIDELSKERMYITLGPGGAPCEVCGGTGRA